MLGEGTDELGQATAIRRSSVKTYDVYVMIHKTRTLYTGVTSDLGAINHEKQIRTGGGRRRSV